MTPLLFFKIEDKSGFFNGDNQTSTHTDVQAYLIFCRNNNNYTAVEDHFKRLGFRGDSLEMLLYRLRLKVNRHHYIFFNEIASDNPLKRVDYAKASVVDRSIYRGVCHLEINDYGVARFWLNKALNMDDKAILAYANLGAISLLEGKTVSALRCFDAALSINQKHEQILANKLEMIVQMPRTVLTEIAKTIKLLLWENPIQPTALHYGIQLAVRLNDIETAVFYLRDYFSYYYLECDMQFLMEQVFSLLTPEQAKAELANLHHFTNSPLSRKVLAFFMKTHKLRYKKLG